MISVPYDVTITSNIGINSHATSHLHRRPTISAVRLCCMALMEPKMLVLSGLPGAHRQILMSCHEVRRLQERRRCSPNLAVASSAASLPPSSQAHTSISSSYTTFQSTVSNVLCRTSDVYSGNSTRFTDRSLDSTCLITLLSSAVPLAVELKLSR